MFIEQIQLTLLLLFLQPDVNVYGAPLPTDWARFNYYAKRIKKLICGRYKYPIVDFIVLHHPGYNLFPSLRSLGWHTNDTVVWNHLSIFVPPTLLSLTITIDFIDRIPLILDPLQKRCPIMEELIITQFDSQTHEIEPPIFRQVSNTLHSFPNLSTLDLNYSHVGFPIANEVLHHLSRLPYLRVLRISLENEYFNPEMLLPFSELAFPLLEELAITCIDIAVINSVVAILAAIFSNKLSKFSIQLPYDANGDDLHPILRQLSTHHSLTFLQLIYQHRTRNLEDTDYMVVISIPARSFSVLFGLSNIDTLILKGIYLDYTGSICEEMAISWPRLRKLQIDQIRGKAERSSGSISYIPENFMDIRQLVHFARYSKHLASISVPYFSTLQTPADFPADMPHRSLGNRLNFYEGGLFKHGMAAALFLHYLFDPMYFIPTRNRGIGKHLSVIRRNVRKYGDVRLEVIFPKGLFIVVKHFQILLNSNHLLTATDSEYTST